MKKQILLVICVFLIFSCSNTKNTKIKEWEKIKEAVTNNDIEYLLKISSDTLFCHECNTIDRIEKELFYSNYPEQMKLNTNENYTYFVEELEEQKGYSRLYRINYHENSKGNNYNIIYSFLEGEKGVKFLGVISIP